MSRMVGWIESLEQRQFLSASSALLVNVPTAERKATPFVSGRTLAARLGKVPTTMTVGTNVNATRMAGNQLETEIAVNPLNANNLVVVGVNQNRNSSAMVVSRSFDGGKTWSEPHPIGVWGLPSHLLRLADGRLLMTYGHRRAPLGNQARISADEGATWSEPMMISTDGTSGDLGYPSTAELPDGTLVTVWYETLKGQKAVLRQAKWKFA